MANTSDEYLIKSFAVSCEGCKAVKKNFEHVAKLLSENTVHSRKINVGIVNCWQYPTICHTKGTPRFRMWNLNNSGLPLGDKGTDRTDVLEWVIEQVESVFGKVDDPAVKPSKKRRKPQVNPPKSKIYGNSPSSGPTNDTSTAKTRLLDAATGFIGGLRKYIRSYEPEEMKALKQWILMVSQTFPGVLNRWLIHDLYLTVSGVTGELNFDLWTDLVEKWQLKTVEIYKKYGDMYHIAEVGRVPETIFSGKGEKFHVCRGTTCGHWWLFHIMTMNPSNLRKPDMIQGRQVDIFDAIYMYMKNFFMCTTCRDHFAEGNVNTRKRLENAADPTTEIIIWLFEMHNSVNRRVGHGAWPEEQDFKTDGVLELMSRYRYTDLEANPNSPDSTWLSLFGLAFEYPAQIALFPKLKVEL